MLPAIYPNQFRQHPYVVFGCLGAGVSMLLAEAVTRQEQSERPISRQTQAKADVGHIEQRDLGARATGNQVTVNVQHPSFAPASGRQMTPTIAIAPPNLEVRMPRQHRDVVVEDNLVRFTRPGEKGNHRCIMLEVINSPAREGQQIGRANCVFATLEIGSRSRSPYDTSVITISRVCWVGKPSNEIAMEISEPEYLLIGLSGDQGEFVIFKNPNRGTPDPTYGVPIVPDADLERSIISAPPAGTSEIVEVNIISNDRGVSHGLTLAHRRIEVNFGDGGAYSWQILE